MKKLKTPKMAAFLPLELITEILTKLPVKFLHRFKCVSKSWNSIITSSKFIKQHLHQTLISNINNNILFVSKNSILSSAISDVELRFDIVHHPLNNIPVDIAGIVHGVLLIVDSSKKTVCLFNPTNKTTRLVPPAPSHKPACDDFDIAEVFGFGYDSVTDDYKIVRLVYLEMFGFDDCVGSGVYREASVYSMRNDSWESVNDETVPYTLQLTNAVAVDEMLCFSVISSDYKPFLKCFDLRTSTFSLVNYPDLDGYDFGNMGMDLMNLRGCLFLVVNYQKVDPAKFMGHPLYNREFLYADVWEMKECGKKESWVKLFRIQNKEINKDCKHHLRLVTYSKDEKSVLLELDSVFLVWYDLVTKRIERVLVQGLRVKDWPYVGYTYVESLVSVEKKNNFLSRDSSLSCEN